MSERLITRNQRASPSSSPARGAGVSGPGNTVLREIIGRRADHMISPQVLNAVQRSAGNRAAARLVQRPRTVVQRRPAPARGRRYERRTEGAIDAKSLVAMYLPFVLPHLSGEQLDMIQRQMDAAVVNPEARERAEELTRRSRKEYGSIVVRDKKLTAEADKAWAQVVSTTLADKRFRVDYTKLLAPDVFSPQKGDADEIAFLKALRRRLDRSGIWLRIADGPLPELWLSLGPDGDHVPSDLGYITRERLLETTALGAMYYRMIYESPKHRSVDAELDALGEYLMAGSAEWHRQEGNRVTADPGVVPISDWFGDADFPSVETWEVPWRTYLQARDAWVKRDLDVAHLLAIIAGVGGTAAGEMLSEYAEATSRGAAIAVKWLERTKVAAEVVFTIASVYAGGAGLVRASARGASAAEGGFMAIGADMEAYVAQHTARELAAVQAVMGPGGQVTNGLKKRLIGLGMGTFF